MVGGEVERVEVVVRRLDLAAVDDLVAQPEEDVLDLAADLRDQMQVAAGPRLARERDVEDVLGSACGRGRPARARTGALATACSRPSQGVQDAAGLRVADLAERLLQLGSSGRGSGRARPRAPRASKHAAIASRLGFQGLAHPSAERIIGCGTRVSSYDAIATLYDDWSRTVTEDVAFYIEEAPYGQKGRWWSWASEPGASRFRSRWRASGHRGGLVAGMLEVCRRELPAAGVDGVLDLRLGDLRDPPVAERARLVISPFRALLYSGD